jgi:hypothetical protein
MTRNEQVTALIYKEESYATIGACMAVYKDKGATGCELGLLVNFGHYPPLEYERLLRGNLNQSISDSKLSHLFLCLVDKNEPLSCAS